MGELSLQEIEEIQEKILSWYEKNKRDLPWRRTTDPYKILVSEVMLQQTQVDRVTPYYRRFIEAFPDVKSLAEASAGEIFKLWSGLGFNGRALRLQKVAIIITKEHNGLFPDTEQKLLLLPGIGPYTARAVLAFSLNKEVSVIDTNIRRILIHECNLPEETSMKELEEIALKLIPKGRSREWHNALMDYGSFVLTARETGIAPLSKQSPFKGSDREVRGFILKQLAKGEVVMSENIQGQFPEKDVKKIIEKMVQDGLVKKAGSRVSFPS